MNRISTMKLGACVGLAGNIDNNNLTLIHTSYGSRNKYQGKSFFDGKNYQSILDCLNDGYNDLMDLMEYMQDQCKLLRYQIKGLNDNLEKWESKLRKQSAISSYNTTRLAQSKTMQTPRDTVQLLEARRNAIKGVISVCEREIERIYPKERFGTTHKHYRAGNMKQQFKAAQSVLSKSSDKLEKLKIQEKMTQIALDEAKFVYENLNSDPISNKNEIKTAAESQTKRKDELNRIKEDIVRTTVEYEKEKTNFCKAATEIYKQCREFEQERLDLIGKTLIQFVEAAYSPDFVTKQHAVHEQLLSDLKMERNTLEDLDFWARTYGVYNTTISAAIETDSGNGEDNDEDVDDDSMSSRTTSRKMNFQQPPTTTQ